MKNRFPRSLHRVRSLLFLGSLLLISSCRSDALGPTLDIQDTTSGELVVQPLDLVLASGASGFLRSAMRTSTGQDLTTFPGSGRVKWSSEAPAIAEVSSDGTVLAKIPGQTRITAELDGKLASAFVVVEPTPARLLPTVEGLTLGTVGSMLRDSLGVQVTDEGGLPVPGVEVHFAVAVGGGAVSSDKVLTDAAGLARVTWRLGSEVGLQAVEVSVTGVPAVFLQAEAEPTSDRLSVEILSGNEQEGEVASVLGQPLRVQVVDEHGNAVSGQPITWEFPHGALASSSQSESEIPLTTALSTTGNSGIAEVSWQLGPVAGTQRAIATLPNGFAAWFTATADAIKVASVEITPQSLQLDPGRTHQYVGRPLDAFGNRVKGVDVDWSSADPQVATIHPWKGLVTAVAPGQTEITGTANGVSASVTLQVKQSGSARLLLRSGSGQSAKVGTRLPAPLVARVIDSGGQGVAGVPVSWTVTHGNGSLSQSRAVTNSSGDASVNWTLGPIAGLQRVSAEAAGLQAIGFTATAQASTANTIRVTPSSLNLQVGGDSRLSATVLDPQGNPLSVKFIDWSTSNAAVATVGDAGLVRAKAVGTATITAHAAGVTGTASVTVGGGGGVTEIKIRAPIQFFTSLNQSSRYTATAMTASGGTLTGIPFEWNSTNGSVARVSDIGLVRPFGNGITYVRACGAGVCDSVRVEVQLSQTQPPALHSVAIRASSTSVPEGGSVTLEADGLDADGEPLPGVTWEWKSAAPQIATVNNTGVVEGVAAGNAVITATGTLAGVSKSANVTMTVTGGGSPPPPPPPPPPSGSPPELPRTYINTGYQAPGGNTIRVNQGDNLQLAINSAQRGDIILLQAGATFVGNFTLPAKPGNGWIVITTDTQLPPQGTRVTPQSAAQFAKIVAPTVQGALFVRPGASQYRIMGVEVTVDRTQAPFSYHLIQLGDLGPAQNDLSEVPRDIILDRVYVHGPTNFHTKRCVEMNASPAAVVDSWLSGCHGWNQDTQAIAVWNAPGPFKIVNNYLAGAGENVLFGGSDPSINGLVPSDIEVRRNHFYKDPAWRSAGYQVKNHFEIKLGRRALIEGNVFENNWVQAQVGFSVLLQSLNDGGSATWAVVEHVTLRYNLITNSAQGINVLARFTATPALPANNILIEHNVLDRIGVNGSYPGQGRLFQVLDDAHNVTIRNNSGIAGDLVLQLDGKVSHNFVFTDNVVTRGRYGIKGNSVQEGIDSLERYAPGYVCVGNVIAGAPSHIYPPGNAFPAGLAQLGFANPQGGNYSLAGSPYAGKGADWQQLTSKIAGVR